MNPVAVVSASIGAGHDGVAAELSRRLLGHGALVTRHDFIDLLPAGALLRTAYAAQLAHAPATWGPTLETLARPRVAALAAAATFHAASAALLSALGPGPAAVVSTYPLASQVLGRLRRTGRLHVPVVAVMTDPSVHPLCVAPGVDLHLAPNEDAASRIRDRFGLPAVVAAPLVHPAFRPARDPGDVLDARRRHGLPLTDRLALVVAGSWGVGEVGETVRDLLAATDAIPVVACGRNDALRDRLAASGRVIALGWSEDMPALLRAADVVVHNAGGLTSVEALASGVPLVSYRCLAGHGVANAAVLARLGLSPWPLTLPELSAALWAALDGDLRARQRAAFAGLRGEAEGTDVIGALMRPSVIPRQRASDEAANEEAAL